jgi:hypothetical protein
VSIPGVVQDGVFLANYMLAGSSEPVGQQASNGREVISVARATPSKFPNADIGADSSSSLRQTRSVIAIYINLTWKCGIRSRSHYCSMSYNSMPILRNIPRPSGRNMW